MLALKATEKQSLQRVLPLKRSIRYVYPSKSAIYQSDNEIDSNIDCSEDEPIFMFVPTPGENTQLNFTWMAFQTRPSLRSKARRTDD